MWINFPIKYQYQFLQLSGKYEQKSEPEDAIYIPAQKEIDFFYQMKLYWSNLYFHVPIIRSDAEITLITGKSTNLGAKNV